LEVLAAKLGKSGYGAYLTAQLRAGR
jgi:hypothetical protein